MLKSQAEFLAEILAQFSEPYNASRGIGPEAEKWASTTKAFRTRANSLFARIKEDAGPARFPQYGGPFYPAPADIITRDLWEMIVREQGINLSFVPEKFRDEAMCRIAVVDAKPYAALHSVPKEHRKEDICLASVKDGNTSLSGIPKELKNSREFCERAVAVNPAALEGVPDELKSLELCHMALDEVTQRHGDIAEIINLVPKPFIDMSFCRKIARILLSKDTERAWQGFYKLQEIIPSVQQCPTACFVREAMDVLRHRAPAQYNCGRTEASCLAEMEHDSFPSFVFVPDELMTDTVRLAACKSNGLCLAFIEEEARTQSVCHAAVASCAKAIDAVPDGVLTSELCMLAVTMHEAALQYVPEKNRTDAICFAAIEHDLENIAYAPKDFLVRAVITFKKHHLDS